MDSGSVGRARPLSQVAAGGVAWLLFQSGMGRIVAFVSQIVLARILLPADYGAVALAATITTFVSVLVTFGVDDVLLQRQKTFSIWAAPGLIIALSLGSIAALLCLLIAPIAASVYKTPSIIGLIAVTAAGMPVGALTAIPTAKLRADLRFRFLSSYGAGETFFMQLLTIALAWLHFGAYSFVLPGLLFVVVRAAVFWNITKPKLIWRGALKRWPMIFRSSAAVVGSKFLTSAVSQGDYALLGLMATQTVVGLYYFAFRLAAQPMRIVAGNFSSVMFPALTRLRNEPDRQLAAAITASKLLSYVAMPLCFLQAAVAEPLLHLVFGHKWQGAVPLVQLLSIGLSFDAVSWVAGALLSARGQFARALAYSCCFSPIFFSAILIGNKFGGATGVAAAVSTYYIIAGPIYSGLTMNRKGAGYVWMLDVYLYPAIIASSSLGIPYLLGRHFLGSTSAALIPIIGVGGGLIYAISVRTLNPTVYFETASKLIKSKRVRTLLWAERSGAS